MSLSNHRLQLLVVLVALVVLLLLLLIIISCTSTVILACYSTSRKICPGSDMRSLGAAWSGCMEAVKRSPLRQWQGRRSERCPTRTAKRMGFRPCSFFPASLAITSLPPSLPISLPPLPPLPHHAFLFLLLTFP